MSSASNIRLRTARLIAVTVAFGIMIGLGSSASACSACFGKSDSALAAGMNWGIFTLLGVIGSVLGGVASFFVYLAKKSAAINGTTVAAASANVTIAEPKPERAEELAGVRINFDLHVS